MIKRYEKNPIFTTDRIGPSQSNLKVIGIFNPGTAIYKDEVVLLARVAESPVDLKDDRYCYYPVGGGDNGIRMEKLSREQVIDDSDPRKIHASSGIYLTSISRLQILRSQDGRQFVEGGRVPELFPQFWYEEYGMEDPRITQIGDVYHITYTGVSRWGMSVCLMTTSDFVSFKKRGVIFLPDNKDFVIFPEKIAGKYWAISRPMSVFGSFMWTAVSADLVSWGGHRKLAFTGSSPWESQKIGAGAVPFLTEAGWLEVYHGVSADEEYSLGYMVLNRDDPSRVIYRHEDAIMRPSADYEIKGFFPDTIFTCGLVNHKGETLLYYSGCDENIALAVMDTEEMTDLSVS